jgi:zinc transport system permease protein
LTATIFAVAMALVVAFSSKRGSLDRDTIIGIVMATSMAIGVLLLSFATSYTGTVMSYLFGNILAVGRTELFFLIAVAILTFVFIALFYKELEFFAFDEQMARHSGIPVDPIQATLLVFIALAVIASIQIAGIILVTALLVVPGAIAMLIGRRFGSLFPISIATGVIASIIGLSISYILDIPSGATIVLTLAIFFAVATIIKKLSKKGR